VAYFSGPDTVVLKEAMEKLIEMDPWEERYTTYLIQFYIQQGNSQAAIEVYNRYKSIVWNQLGIEPQEELTHIMSLCDKQF